MFNLKEKDLFTNKRLVMLIAVICSALWAGTTPAIKIGLQLFTNGKENVMTEIFFAGMCFTASGIVTMVVLCIFGKEFRLVPSKNVLAETIIIGLVQTAVQYIFLYIGIRNTTGFNAAVFSSVGIFPIVIMSHFLYKDEKLNVGKLAGCILGICGVILLEYNSNGFGFKDINLYGDGFVLLSTLAFVGTVPACRSASRKGDPALITGQAFLIGGIVLLVVGYFGGGKVHIGSLVGAIIFLYLIIAYSVSGVLWNFLLKYNDASRINFYNFLVPVFGALFSAVILGERVFDFSGALSLVLVCLGIYYAEKPSRFKCVA